MADTNSTISRRNLLRGAAVTCAAASIVASASEAAPISEPIPPVDQNPDSELLADIAAFVRVYDEYQRAEARAHGARYRADKAPNAPKYPAEIMEELDARGEPYDPAEIGRAHQRELHAHWKHYGVDEAYERWNALSEECGRRILSIFPVHARTLAGILAKMTLANRLIADKGGDEQEAEMWEGFDGWRTFIQRDLERLAGVV